MTNMIDYLGVGPAEGEVGIEIELEGGNLPMDNFNEWRAERDGSLRGESVELVLKKPVARDKVRKALTNFKSAIANSHVEDSGRAGIHVHINIQKMTPAQLGTFMVLYTMFENPLVDYCGKRRVGNLFCLRADDAELGVNVIAGALQQGRFGQLATDNLRYASMNVKAIPTYGSLEFRAMRSTTDINIIEEWVNILLRLKDQAMTFESPIEAIECVSREGVVDFFETVVGPHIGVLEVVPEELWRGIRHAQIIAYCREDWKKFDVKKDWPKFNVRRPPRAPVGTIRVIEDDDDNRQVHVRVRHREDVVWKNYTVIMRWAALVQGAPERLDHDTLYTLMCFQQRGIGEMRAEGFNVHPRFDSNRYYQALRSLYLNNMGEDDE